MSNYNKEETKLMTEYARLKGWIGITYGDALKMTIECLSNNCECLHNIANNNVKWNEIESKNCYATFIILYVNVVGKFTIFGPKQLYGPHYQSIMREILNIKVIEKGAAISNALKIVDREELEHGNDSKHLCESLTTHINLIFDLKRP